MECLAGPESREFKGPSFSLLVRFLFTMSSIYVLEEPFFISTNGERYTISRVVEEFYATKDINTALPIYIGLLTDLHISYPKGS